jgi:hypothetical protein
VERRDSDATPVLSAADASPGTDPAVEIARRLGWPVYTWAAASSPGQPNVFRRWLQVYRLHMLDVAGARESKSPGIYAAARAYLHTVLLPLAIRDATARRLHPTPFRLLLKEAAIMFCGLKFVVPHCHR